MEQKNTEISNELSLKEFITKAKEWISFLGRYWLSILFLFLISGIIGFFYARIIPVTFTAKTTFVVEESKASTASLGGLASLAGQFGVEVGGNGGGGLLSGDNILLYFKSPSLAREVLLTKFNKSSDQSLADLYVQVYKLREEWDGKQNIGNIKFPPIGIGKGYTRLQDSLLNQIIQKIIKTQFAVSRVDKKAGFIEVSTVMRDEVLAKIYCEKIVELAVEKYLSIKTQRQKATVEKLQIRVDSIASLLKQKTVSSARLQTTSGTMDINPLFKTDNSIAFESTARDKAMLATMFATITQNLEVAKFTLSQDTPAIQIIDAPILPLYNEKASPFKYGFIFSLSTTFVYIVFLILRRLYKIILS